MAFYAGFPAAGTITMIMIIILTVIGSWDAMSSRLDIWFGAEVRKRRWKAVQRTGGASYCWEFLLVCAISRRRGSRLIAMHKHVRTYMIERK